MKLLDLTDLDITPYNYKSKQDGVREWFLESLQYFPETFSDISKKTGVYYRSLLKFSSGKRGLNFKNLLAIATYTKGLMKGLKENEKALDTFTKDQCFNG